MPRKNKPAPKKPPKLTQKQKMFCHEYMKDFNATQAAIRSGYKERSASEMGFENLRKPQIAEFLAKETDKRVMGSHEAKKLLSDIAKSSVNDFIVVRLAERRPRTLVPIQQAIEDLEARLRNETDIARQSLNSDEMTLFLMGQRDRKTQLIQWMAREQLEPNAKVVVEGDPVLEEVAELDLIKLARDKELGRIKSLSYNNIGMPKVELYAADAALVNINKIHGNFEKDHEQAGQRKHSGTIQTQEIDNVDYEALSDDVLHAIVKARKKASDEEPAED